MKKLPIETITQLAMKMRMEVGMSQTEPIHTKTLLRKLGVMAMYRPLSDRACGFSMRSADEQMKFMLTPGLEREPSEINANAFASAMLLPPEGVIKVIPAEEIRTRNISMATFLRLEQLFEVSHQSLCYCLKRLKLLTEEELQMHLQESKQIQDIATSYGYDTALYQSGNENVTIGDFGEKARKLFDMERISEGHYLELLNLLR